MKNWIKNHVILTWVLFGLIAFLVINVLPAVRNYYGYCEKEKRYLSDEDKIRRFIQLYAVDTPNSSTINDSPNKMLSYLDTNYSSVKMFTDANPDCCHFADSKHPVDFGPPSFEDRISGHYSNVLIIKYKTSNINMNGKSFITEEIAIDNCGERVRW